MTADRNKSELIELSLDDLRLKSCIARKLNALEADLLYLFENFEKFLAV